MRGPGRCPAKNGDPGGAPDLGRGPAKKSGAPQIPAGPRTLRGGAGPNFRAPAPRAVWCRERNLHPAPPRSEHYPWPTKNPFPAPHCRAGWGIFLFFTLPHAPSGALHFWGPVFASPCKFPITGPHFLGGTIRGPTNCSQFRARNANFWHMLSNKHTLECQRWQIFTIWRVLSTGSVDYWHILWSKNMPEPQS